MKNTVLFFACFIIFSLLFIGHDAIKEHLPLVPVHVTECCVAGAISAGLFVLLINKLNGGKPK